MAITVKKLCSYRLNKDPKAKRVECFGVSNADGTTITLNTSISKLYSVAWAEVGPDASSSTRLRAEGGASNVNGDGTLTISNGRFSVNASGTGTHGFLIRLEGD